MLYEFIKQRMLEYPNQIISDGNQVLTYSEMIKQAQKNAIMRNPGMAAATLVGAQADAMKAAASNSNGAMTGFLGMGMAQNAGGINTNNLFSMNQQNENASNQDSWKCSCGNMSTGKFCQNCGKARPSATSSWKCECGSENIGKFCQNCGKPHFSPQIPQECPNCGWKPFEGRPLPKFCPNCGKQL